MNSRRVAPSYYDILGVPPSAGPDAIEKAFRDGVREARDQPGGGDRTHQLNIAYRALRNPEKRRGYDAALAGAPLPRAERAMPRSAFFGAETQAPLPQASAPMPPPPERAAVPPQARSPAPVPPVSPTMPPSQERAAVPPEARSPDSTPPVTPPPEPLAEPAAVPLEARSPAPPPPAMPLPPEPAEPAVERPGTYPEHVGSDVPMDRQEPAPVEPPPPAAWSQPAYAPADQPDYYDEPYQPEPAYADERIEDHERPQRRRNKLVALAALIGLGLLGLLLLIGRTITGSDPDQPQVAASDRGGSVQAEAGRLAQGRELADASPAAPTTGGDTATAVSDSGFTQVGVGTAPAARADELAPLPEGGAAANGASAAGRPADTQVAERTDDAPPAAAADEPEARAPETRTAEAAPAPSPPPAPRVSRATPARYLGGGLVDSDNAGGRFEGAVGVRLTVLPNGRTSNCRVTRSSGNPNLDATTCNLLERRLQFTPALNSEGQPMATEIRSTYTWGRSTRRGR